MARVVFEGVTKRFDGRAAVDGLTLDVHDRELLVLLGPSGCGKTTALRMLAGLEDPTEGRITIGDRAVNDVAARDRDVAMVFQTYALYPHLSVRRNIEFPLGSRRVARPERRRLVAEAASMLGLTELLERKPAQLSGGQRQRVALARAIVRHPQVFLMDEPLSNLDAALRTRTRADIVALQRRLATTTIYVTHDQVEAMTMADRIAVLSEGALQQVDHPQDVYARPANLFVARFVGTPPMNTLAGTAAVEGEAVRIAGPAGVVDLEEPLASVARSSPTGRLQLGVRAEDVRLDPSGPLPADVVLVERLGHDAHVVCRLADDTTVVARQPADAHLPRVGDAVRLAVDPARLHLFDAESGLRLGP